MITYSKHPKISIISIVKWDCYQTDNTVRTPSQHPRNTLGTPSQQEYNNVNNENNVNNDNKDIAQKDAPVKRKRFEPPSFQELSDYFFLKGGSSAEAEKFMAFYESKGWLVGKAKMKDWQAAVRGWIARNKSSQKPKQDKPSRDEYYEQLANRRFE